MKPTDLLPEGKVEKCFKDAGKRLAFVGDGVQMTRKVAWQMHEHDGRVRFRMRPSKPLIL
jgi:hypothetical protein